MCEKPGVKTGYSIDFSTTDKIRRVKLEINWVAERYIVRERWKKSGDIESEPKTDTPDFL